MPLLEFHKTLLSDVSAQEGFRRAIASSVKGGDAVLDVGTGTGLHAFFACQAGARVVYAVDESPVIELAKAAAIANGFDGRIRFIRASAQEVELPEPVDVITAHLGLADTMALLPQVAARHLRPSGVVIPSVVELCCAPVESQRAYEQIAFWGKRHYGLDFTPVRLMAVRSPHTHRTSCAELLAEGVRVTSISLVEPARALGVDVDFRVARDGVLHGVAMWYVEHLSGGTTLSSGPSSTLDLKVWRDQFFPCASPRPVRCGDRVAVRLDAAAELGEGWRWEIDVRPGR